LGFSATQVVIALNYRMTMNNDLERNCHGILRYYPSISLKIMNKAMEEAQSEEVFRPRSERWTFP
jgi:hypothetical protein